MKSTILCPSCNSDITTAINKMTASRAGTSKSEAKKKSSAANGLNQRSHFEKTKYFLQQYPHRLKSNDHKIKIPLIINGEKTTYNPDFWCEKTQFFIEVATSISNVSTQSKKWRACLSDNHKLKIFWWQGDDITKAVIENKIPECVKRNKNTQAPLI